MNQIDLIKHLQNDLVLHGGKECPSNGHQTASIWT